MNEGTQRTATALVTFEGRPVATIGPFPVATPWWADVAPVAAHLERELGVPVAVLRLVDVTGGAAPPQRPRHLPRRGPHQPRRGRRQTWRERRR